MVEDAFGLKPRFNPLTQLTANTRWAFQTNPEKLKAFQRWFKEQVDTGLLDIEPGAADPLEPWTAKHTGSAYKKGVRDAFIASKRKALDVESDFFEGMQSEFLQSSFGGKIGTAQIEMLATRSFEKLKDISGGMSGEISRILSGGLANGLGARQISKQMTDSISSIDRIRSMRIARTEIIHAYAEGQLDSFDALGIEEVGILSEWSTVDGACPLCLPMEGVVFKVKEARGLIPRHVLCRCSWLPVIPSKVSARVDREGREALKREGRTRQLTPSEIAKTKPPKTTKSQIEAAIRKSVRAERPKASKEEAFRRSPSRIADVKIFKSRAPGKPRPPTPPEVPPTIKPVVPDKPPVVEKAFPTPEPKPKLLKDEFGVKIGTDEADINEALSKGVLTAREISLSTGVPLAKVKKHMRRMVNLGFAGKTPKGSFFLIPPEFAKPVAPFPKPKIAKPGIKKKTIKIKPKRKPTFEPDESPIGPPVRKLENINDWLRSLPKGQKSAIGRYTKGSDQDIRRIQKGDLAGLSESRVRSMRKLTTLMEKAFETAPEFEGEVFRGIGGLSDEVFRKLTQRGRTMTMQAFTSFSEKKSVAQGFLKKAGENPILFRVKDSGGVSIRGLSKFAFEDEVLVPEGTKYKIIKTRNVELRDLFGKPTGQIIKEVTLERILPQERRAA